MIKRVIFFLSTFLIGGFNHQVLAQDNQISEWEWVVAPYGWLGSIGGNIGVGRAGVGEVSADFGDILDVLKFAATFHGEAQKGKWGGMVDVLYMKLGDDLTTPRDGMVEATMEILIIEAFLNHRFGQDWGHVDVYAGVRIWDINSDLGLNLPGGFMGDFNIGESFVDPVIGGRVLGNFSDKWYGILRSDIGGFGAGSDFSFSVQPTVGYRFTNTFSLALQYKYLSTDFETGESGTEDFFLFDAHLKGPLLGFVFQF